MAWDAAESHTDGTCWRVRGQREGEDGPFSLSFLHSFVTQPRTRVGVFVVVIVLLTVFILEGSIHPPRVQIWYGS